MSRMSTVLLALLLTSGCAPRHTISLPDASQVRIETMPSSLGEYTIAEVVRFPEASAGALYRYRGGTLEPDVYLYPLKDPDASTGGDPHFFVRAEAEFFPIVLDAYRDEGRYDDFVIVADSAVSIAGPVVVPGWHTRARIRYAEGWYDSHQHLFSFQDQMVKVRISEPAQDSDTDSIGSFVRALVTSLLAPAN